MAPFSPTSSTCCEARRRRAPTESPVATGGAQPKRAARAAISADKPDAARDRARALRLHQHGQHTHPQHLFQARCARSFFRRSKRAGAAAPLDRALLNIAETGGTHDGLVYQPTILTDVPYEATASNEETFGPLVIVEAVDSPEDAVAVANRVPVRTHLHHPGRRHLQGLRTGPEGPARNRQRELHRPSTTRSMPPWEGSVTAAGGGQALTAWPTSPTSSGSTPPAAGRQFPF